MYDFLIDQMPFLAHATPLTVFGLLMIALATVLYLATRMPEFLLVMFVSVAYIVAPHLPHLC